MLHKLEQSPATIDALRDALRVQFALLAYAAQTETPRKTQCEAFVEQRAGLAGRGQAAASWAWNTESRRKPLSIFARMGPRAEKTAWVELMQREADALLAGVPRSLTPLDQSRLWMMAGGKFLQQFYAAFSSEGGLPAEMLGRARNFGRHDFLQGFTDANRGVYVCGSCDEARIGTRRKGRLHADIDHFFPKSVYPHLCVHPHNLIPICHSCNSFTKGKVDPLGDAKSGRCTPADLVLPYRTKGLAERSFLVLDLDSWRIRNQPFALKPRKRDRITQRQLVGFARIADIPARWNERVTVDEIGETAFRRLGQYLQAQPELLADPDRLLKKLDEFLGTLQCENLGRDPLTFPIQWFLAGLAHAAHRDASAKAPLLRELREWNAGSESIQRRQAIGEELRSVLASS